MKLSPRLTFILLAVGLVVLFGSSFVLTKVALAWVGPISLAFLRWLVSAVVLGLWLAWRGKLPLARRALRQDAFSIAWIGLVGISLFYGLQNVALRYTTAVNAGILTNLISVFMALLAVFWFQERPKAGSWLAMGISFAGAAVVSQGSGHLTLGGSALRGDALMVLASVFGAIYSLGARQLGVRYPADVTLALIAAPGALFLLPFALWEGLTLALPPAIWGVIALLGVGSGALANLCWIEMMGRTSAARVGMLLYFIPIFSAILAVVALGEQLTAGLIGGGALVLGGVALMQKQEQ